MYRRLTALIIAGTSFHFAPGVTIVQEHLMWTKNLFQSQVIFNFSALWVNQDLFYMLGVQRLAAMFQWHTLLSTPTPQLLRKTKSTVDGIISTFVFLLF